MISQNKNPNDDNNFKQYLNDVILILFKKKTKNKPSYKKEKVYERLEKTKENFYDKDKELKIPYITLDRLSLTPILDIFDTLGSDQKEQIIRELNREKIFEQNIDLSYFSCLRTRIYLVGIRNCVVHNNSLKIFKMYRYGYETRSKKEIHDFNKLMLYLLNKK